MSKKFFVEWGNMKIDEERLDESCRRLKEISKAHRAALSGASGLSPDDTGGTKGSRTPPLPSNSTNGPNENTSGNP